MRKRTLNPNASHSQAAAFVTSGYANTGITVARAIDLFESIISPPSGFSLLTHIADRLYISPIASELSIAMSQPHDILFKTLADPTRRAIFERLCRDGDQTVGALTALAGVSQPAVSKHLGVLKQAGLVRDRHEGRRTHYSAQLGALAPLIDWTSQMAGFWQSRFDHLEDLLKRMDQ
jgi:DNA-binding transcriptional ArsR family regulator